MSDSPLPNILVILNDDMGYSDLGCYGSEIDTPNLDRLAAGGLRFSRFYNTPRCSPSRASLLTGLHPHQAGIGVLTGCNFDGDYPGNLNDRCATIPEVLNPLGYRSYISGKWHLTKDFAQPNGAWPVDRGFHHHYGIICGGANFYHPKYLVRDRDNVEHEARENPDYFFTDAVNDEAVKFLETHFTEHAGKPFFQYVAHTAPHWPLHAHEEDIAKYRGRFDAGWDELRKQRHQRLIDLGLIDPKWKLTARDPGVSRWSLIPESEREWYLRRMEVYAAQIDRMDQGIGRILETLERHGQLENTLILFLSDNGGCSEDFPRRLPFMDTGQEPEWCRLQTRDGRPVHVGNDPALMPGPETTYQSYGVCWANVSNTPFRMYKHWTHEGGIATPLIAHWPKGIAARGEIRHQHAYLPDVMATVLEMTDAEYPRQNAAGETIPVPEGESLLPVFEGRDLPQRMMFWEHEGNAAVREGVWKLVKNFSACPTGKRFSGEERGDWELYETAEDGTEMRNLASKHPERVQRMASAWENWAQRAGVIPHEEWLAAQKRRVPAAD